MKKKRIWDKEWWVKKSQENDPAQYTQPDPWDMQEMVNSSKTYSEAAYEQQKLDIQKIREAVLYAQQKQQSQWNQNVINHYWDDGQTVPTQEPVPEEKIEEFDLNKYIDKSAENSKHVQDNPIIWGGKDEYRI